MHPLIEHPQQRHIRAQLASNVILRTIKTRAFGQIERMLTITDHKKGDLLLDQGEHEMEQYFVLDGILKRVVSNQEGREMILRFTAEDDIETSYAAWRLRTPTPYAVRAVTRARVARLSMQDWADFLDQHPVLKSDFEYEVMHLMSEVMAHTITLHLLDAAGRLQRFLRKQPHLYGRVPMKELALYLNISPETLSRLKHRVKIADLLANPKPGAI